MFVNFTQESTAWIPLCFWGSVIGWRGVFTEVNKQQKKKTGTPRAERVTRCGSSFTEGDGDKDRALSPVIDLFIIRDYDIFYKI